MDERINLIVQFLEATLATPADSRLPNALQERNGLKEEQIVAVHLARITGLSATRLRSVFKAEMGTTPLQYFRRRRREEARQMAETTTLTVSQILFDLGVADASHFLRRFKKEFGKTMIECRKEARARQAAEREITSKEN